MTFANTEVIKINNINIALENIFKSIETIVETQIKKLKYDITAKGIVTKVLPNNKYQVAILGSEYVIECKEKAFKKNETVYVLIPQSNFNEMVILSAESGQANNQVNIGDIPNLEDILSNISNDIAKLTEDIQNINVDLISSEETDKIKINEDKTLSLNNVSTDRIVNGEEEVILFGGNA